ncbi:hypothetical protein FOCC_FOCC016513 [Frankliniella occidentalis]|nr:hypothetical protein FOCC_FOCC016513 [Frankliniella occidentalis]
MMQTWEEYDSWVGKLYRNMSASVAQQEALQFWCANKEYVDSEGPPQKLCFSFNVERVRTADEATRLFSYWRNAGVLSDPVTFDMTGPRPSPADAEAGAAAAAAVGHGDAGYGLARSAPRAEFIKDQVSPFKSDFTNTELHDGNFGLTMRQVVSGGPRDFDSVSDMSLGEDEEKRTLRRDCVEMALRIRRLEQENREYQLYVQSLAEKKGAEAKAVATAPVLSEGLLGVTELEAELDSCAQGKSEGVAAYGDRLAKLHRRFVSASSPGYSGAARSSKDFVGRDLISRFKAGLQPALKEGLDQALARRLGSGSVTYDMIYGAAVRLERENKSKKVLAVCAVTAAPAAAQARPAPKAKVASGNPAPVLEGGTANPPTGQGAVKKDHFPGENAKCYQCNGVGHFKRNCPSRANRQAGNPGGYVQRCQFCKELGHSARGCPTLPQEVRQQLLQGGTPSAPTASGAAPAAGANWFERFRVATKFHEGCVAIDSFELAVHRTRSACPAWQVAVVARGEDFTCESRGCTAEQARDPLCGRSAASGEGEQIVSADTHGLVGNRGVTITPILAGKVIDQMGFVAQQHSGVLGEERVITGSREEHGVMAARPLGGRPRSRSRNSVSVHRNQCQGVALSLEPKGRNQSGRAQCEQRLPSHQESPSPISDPEGAKDDLSPPPLSAGQNPVEDSGDPDGLPISQAPAWAGAGRDGSQELTFLPSPPAQAAGDAGEEGLPTVQEARSLGAGEAGTDAGLALAAETEPMVSNEFGAGADGLPTHQGLPIGWNEISLQQRVRVGPGVTKTIWVQTQLPAGTDLAQWGLGVLRLDALSVRVASKRVDSSGQIAVELTNYQPVKVSLPVKTVIAEVETMEDANLADWEEWQDHLDKAYTGEKSTAPFLSKFDLSHLGAEEREQVGRVLLNHQDAFIEDGKLAPPTPVLQYKVNVDPSIRPVYRAPYSVSKHREEDYDEEINKWLALGVIEEANSPWAAPISMVTRQQPNGKIKKRLVCDLRAQNAHTLRDNFPPPNMQEILNSLHGANYISVFDVSNAYLCVEIHPDSRDFFGLVTKKGTYRCKRMIFGAKNSGAVYCRACLETDPDFSGIFKELTVGLLQSSDYQVQDGLLYKLPGKKERRTRVCVPLELREGLMEAYHCAPWAGHNNYKRMYDKVRERWYWPGMSQDIYAFAGACHKCALRKRGTHGAPAPLQEHVLPTRPFQYVSCDVVGPLPVSVPDEYRYIVTFICLLTKFTEAVAVRSQTTEDVARAFVNQLVARYGVPDYLLTDNGACYVSEMFGHVTKLLGVTHLRCTPLRPQAQGSIERSHRTLGEALSMYVNSRGNDWPEFLQLVAMSMRSAVNRSTGETPYYLLTGFDMQLPYDLLTEPVAVRHDLADNMVGRLQSDARHIFRVVRDRMRRAARASRAYYNKNARHPKFELGNLVYLLEKSHKKGVSRKFRKRYSGPWRLEEKKSPTTWRLKRVYGRKERVVHCDRLKIARGYNDILGAHAREMSLGKPAQKNTGEEPRRSARLRAAARRAAEVSLSEDDWSDEDSSLEGEDDEEAEGAGALRALRAAPEEEALPTLQAPTTQSSGEETLPTSQAPAEAGVALSSGEEASQGVDSVAVVDTPRYNLRKRKA